MKCIYSKQFRTSTYPTETLSTHVLIHDLVCMPREAPAPSHVADAERDAFEMCGVIYGLPMSSAPDRCQVHGNGMLDGFPCAISVAIDTNENASLSWQHPAVKTLFALEKNIMAFKLLVAFPHTGYRAFGRSSHLPKSGNFPMKNEEQALLASLFQRICQSPSCWRVPCLSTLNFEQFRVKYVHTPPEIC